MGRRNLLQFYIDAVLQTSPALDDMLSIPYSLADVLQRLSDFFEVVEIVVDLC